jgi:hypothetical protein
MSKVILDDTIRAKLQDLSRELELCDPSGQTLGRFVPEPLYNKLLYALAESQRPALSPEEVARRQQETGGRSLAEIWKRLGPS